MGGARAAAVVPAYNEEKTVGEVVRTLVASGFFSEVIVVSDGSSDGTAAAARAAGATLVHELPRNRGKGAALGHGVMHTDAEVICFFDADLKGLTAEHVRQVLAPVTRGERFMNIGLLYRGPLWNWLAERLPLVGGQRAVRREIFVAIPPKYVGGYRVEAALNWFCRVNGLPLGVVTLRGLDFVRKIGKVGLLRGSAGYARMLLQVGWGLIRIRLARREFVEHGGHMGHRHS